MNITSFDKLNQCQNEEQVCLQGRIHTLRSGKKHTFVILRERHQTIQLFITNENIKNIIDPLKSESVIRAYGKLMKLNDGSVKSCTITNMEIHIDNIEIISENQYELPIQVHNVDKIGVHMDMALEHRAINLRTIENSAIFQIQSLMCNYFRTFMTQNDFIEINTPKLISTASESGASVFTVDYYGKQRYLAQSAQLFKQTMINAGYKRVFEIAPAFRAEKSTGPRHLCEFVSLDIEMEFQHDYLETPKILYQFLVYLFDNLHNNHQDLLKNIHSYKPLQYPKEPVILNYWDSIKMLEEWGYKAQCPEDINTEDEKQIGNMVKEKFNSDIVIINKYPKDARPFYSMTCNNDPNITNSYDIILCGNEILSGSQRENNYQKLIYKAKEKGVNVENIKDYIDSFKYGSPPHAGGAFGLERLTKFFLGIDNIRMVSLFPNYYHG
jgi:nondiscriminating aspartyl-tRNA synthetase